MTIKYELPEEAAETLKSLRSTNEDEFYAYVKSLRGARWSLRSIAESLNVSHSIVKVWTQKAETISEIPVPAIPGNPQKQAGLAKPPKVSISASDKERILELATEASTVRRFTAQDSPARAAAAELEDLLHFYKDKGVPLSELASAANVTRRAIAQRLEKKKVSHDSSTAS